MSDNSSSNMAAIAFYLMFGRGIKDRDIKIDVDVPELQQPVK
jgi:hypothetical protein